MMAVKKIRMSAEGFKDLEKQLEYLKNVRRAEVAQKLKEARSFGDLSENAEYDEAKNEQAILEAEIADIEMKISNAEVVSDEDLSTDEIGVGSIVKLKDLEFDEILELQIVGSTEADPENNKISEDAPIGIAALKKKVGDILEVEAPMGIIKMEVLEISK
ncbi:MAG: transcription elongation factor GreA [Oscillospiraceae bacterium]|nr:transcription elongation factor GreA [Oscillospiraceae bacterium]